MSFVGCKSNALSFLCRSGWPGRAALLLGLALFAWVPASNADSVPVGVLSFDQIIPSQPGFDGVNGFAIFNFTGSNALPGTPGSAISFLNTSLLLNGGDLVNVGTIDPGSVQPFALQFSSSTNFSKAVFTATLGTLYFTIGGQQYVATSNQLSGDLVPFYGPNLIAGADLCVLSVDANPTTIPEPSTWLLLLGPLAMLARRIAHSRV